MQNKKQVSTILAVLILIGVFALLRGLITGGIGGNIKDSDLVEDSQTAQAGCTPPTLSNIAVGSITGTSAIISWTTNQTSTSVAKLGTTSYNMTWKTILDTPASSSGVTTHAYVLSNLTPSTTYYYRARSSNGSCQKTSSTYSFTTSAGGGGTLNPDTTAPPTPTGLSASNITSNSFTLSWNASIDPAVTGATTSDNVRYEVYGPTSCAVLGISGYCGSTTTGNSLSITGLAATTTYSGSSGTNAGFTVLAFDSANNYSQASTRLTVTTTAGTDTTPPNILSLSSTGITATQVTINWTTNEASTSVVNYGTTSAYGTLVSNTTLTTNHSVTISGLSPATSYQYQVRSADAAGNTTTTSENAFTTTSGADTTAPTISSVGSSGITTTGATVSWSTNEAATGVVDYGTTTSYGQTVSNTALSTGHSATLSGLSAGTIYHYHVKSADAAGNLATSTDYTLTTQSSGTSCPNAQTNNGQPNQMWEWKNNVQIIEPGSQTQTDLFNFVDSHNIKVLYLNAPTSWLNSSTTQTKLRAFLTTARDQHCLSVEALNGASNWVARPGNGYFTSGATTTAAMDFTNAVKNFNATVTGTGAKFTALQFDVEPYLLNSSSGYVPYWDQNTSATIAIGNALIDMLTEVKGALAGTGILLDLAPPRWYDTQSNTKNTVFVKTGGITGKSLMQHLMDVVDIYTIQDYVVTASSVYADASSELSYGASIGKKVRIGLETTPGWGTSTSFWDAGATCTSLMATLNTAYNSITSTQLTAFDGFAVEQYKDSNNVPYSYSAMCP